MSLRSARRSVLALVLALAVLPSSSALAQNNFVARVDRNEITLGEVLTLEITLSLGDGRADGYMPPEFTGFRILGEYPSQSTQIQIAGGQQITRNIYSWRYELSPTQSGRLVIAPAKVRAGGGRELKTAPIPVVVHSGALQPGGRTGAQLQQQQQAQPQPQRRQRGRVPRLGSPFDDLFGGADPAPEPEPSGGRNFIRVASDKTRAYVGEQILVEWSLYLSESVDRYEPQVEARTDGFWSEDLSNPNTRGTLNVQKQMFEGRTYIVASLSQRALFPLQAGTLTITPMESQISRADFFGRSVRQERVRAEPLKIEVLPLPTAGKPANFDPAAVGRFNIEAKVDRNEVSTGEPVSLIVTVTGQGNLRKLAPPRLGALEGWKLYEPKTDVKVETQGGVSGVKTVEYLLQAERPGTTIVPAFELTFFDPATRRYVTEKSAPLRLVAKGAAVATTAGGKPAGGGAGDSAVENVIGAELRPPRSRASLGRDLGTTVYRSPLFSWALFFPPLAYATTVVVGRVRARMGKDTEGARRRKTRQRVKHHLRAAEKAMSSGSPAGFYAEIDRVLRELLTARLGQPVAGHSRDELPSLITGSGLPPAVSTRIVAILDECDRARFAPGSLNASDLSDALERAEELIPLIEKAPQRRRQEPA